MKITVPHIKILKGYSLIITLMLELYRHLCIKLVILINNLITTYTHGFLVFELSAKGNVIKVFVEFKNCNLKPGFYLTSLIYTTAQFSQHPFSVNWLYFRI